MQTRCNMRVDNTKRYICCLFAAIVLFLGMCVDTVETDSFFLYSSATSSDAHISSMQVNLDDDTTCTNEMLGRSRTMQLRNVYQRNTSSEQYRNLLLSFIVGVILQYLFLLQMAERYTSNRKIYSDIVTVTYIHQKDGEK